MRRGALAEVARAKVNLCLHIVGQRPDGYHLLESLVVFPALGDAVEVEAAQELSLTVDGPFAAALDAGADNLVLRAAELLRRDAGLDRGAALRLTKSLPIGAGVGGGSADAATTLRLLRAAWDLETPPERLHEIAAQIGADVPACLSDGPVWMSGIGEILRPAPRLPTIWLTLVNPGAHLSTPEVFKALVDKSNPPPAAPPRTFETVAALVDWLAETRNDLAAPAEALRPEIAQVRDALARTADCRLARMSGSGATCFGLYDDASAAMAAAEALRAAHPAWWVAAAPVAP